MKAIGLVGSAKVKALAALGMLGVIALLGGTYGVKAASTATPYKIGYVLTLTGAAAYYGEDIEYCSNLAISSANKHGGANGHKIEGVYEDDALLPARAVTETQSLTKLQGIKVLIINGSDIVSAVESTTEQAHALLINPTGADASLANAAGGVFTATPTYGQEEAVMAKYLIAHHIRTLGTLTDDSTTGVALDAALVADYDALGGEVVAQQSFDPSATNFSAQLATIAAAKPQALFAAPKEAAQSVVMASEAATYGLKINYANTFFEDPALPTTAGHALLNGTIYTHTGFIPGLNSLATSLQSSWSKKYPGTVVSAPCSEGYDATVITIAALRHAGLSVKKMTKWLLTEKGVLASGGKYVFDSRGQAVGLPIALKEYRNNKFIFLKK